MPDAKNRPARKPGHIRSGLLFVYGLTFFLICAIPLAAQLIGIQTTNLEARTLSARPALISEGQLNLAFTNEFERYYADHFPLRANLISAWDQLNRTVLQQSGSDRVVLGKSGWLFYQDTVDDYLAVNTLDEVALNRLEILLGLQRNWLAAQDIGFVFTVAPNKNTIYGDKMPDRYQPLQAENNLARLTRQANRFYLTDLAAALKQAAAEQTDPLYHKTDSHWNNRGARLACQTLLQAILPILPDLTLENRVDRPYVETKDWQGDLAVMLYPSGPELDWQQDYADEPYFRFSKPIKSLEDMLIQTQNTTGRYNLLMFRDSFGNALIPLLADTFAQVLYSRTVPYDYALVDTVKPDLVILEIVERNLPQLLEQAPRIPACPVQQTIWADAAASAARITQTDRIVLKNQTEPEGQTVLIIDQDLTWQADMDGEWLKISGRWLDATWQSQADRVILELANGSGPEEKTAYEASPISAVLSKQDEKNTDAAAESDSPLDWQQTGGFTLYLQQDQWLTGNQTILFHIHTALGWRTASLEVSLPD